MNLSIKVAIRPRGGIRLARMILRLAPILGAERANRWAMRAYYWRVRVRLDNGPWQRCEAP